MHARLKGTFDEFIDVSDQSHERIAELVRAREIDIAVDLMGFTRGAREDVYALRPSPIQVNYLGYPGTMGAPYIDYIIADRTVISEAHQQDYVEKIAYLPDTFQANDRKCPIADKVFHRIEVGLPEGAFVFCNFNANYKISPEMFDLWMRVVRSIDDSVLWLVAEGQAADNLRREAVTRGVAAERLIFAPRLPLAEHESRMRLADLCLDTSPYNGGATASGVLWAGVPIITRMSETFAGRMSASLLNAVGLPELVTDSAEKYEALALELATRPEKLASVKQKLARNRETCALFDTERFTRHIEAAYTTMWQRQQRGEPPRAFAVETIGQH